ERANHLGGLWTGGLVLPLLSTHGTGKDGRRIQVIHGLGGEMASRLKDMGMAINTINPVIDPEAGKYLLDQMIADSGVKMLYHCQAADAIMDGDTIRGIFIESKNGRQAVLAKVVIDCTGDGDVYSWAGEKYDKVLCDIGLVHRIGNADRINRKAPGYKTLNVGGATPIKGVRWVNMLGEHDQDGTDMLTLSRLQQKHRIDIWNQMKKMHATPGYEEVFLVDTAPQLGVRASRLLDGEYQLTLNDTLTYKQFDDAIGVCGAWCTLRNLPGGRKIAPKDRPYWQIPYRTLVPKKTDNLLVAGRCTSYERALVEDCRVIGPCLVTGQGAGAAAALAVKNGVRPRDVDHAALRKLLLDQKVWLG
ncbi:MAG: FAD-dependent oxidoreductase, partial [Muribaculaceae bacterium]|nr:FAD-dependent oxidoreductase [Muribaculaceae bacterium]